MSPILSLFAKKESQSCCPVERGSFLLSRRTLPFVSFWYLCKRMGKVFHGGGPIRAGQKRLPGFLMGLQKRFTFWGEAERGRSNS